MQQWWQRLWLALLMVGICLAPAALVHATALPDGKAVRIEAGDNFLATLWDYACGPLGKLAGLGVVYSGLSKMGSREDQEGSPIKRMAGGVGIAFGPNILTTAFSGAGAATGADAAVVSMAVLVRQGFLGGRLWQDPVFWL